MSDDVWLVFGYGYVHVMLLCIHEMISQMRFLPMFESRYMCINNILWRTCITDTGVGDQGNFVDVINKPTFPTLQLH